MLNSFHYERVFKSSQSLNNLLSSVGDMTFYVQSQFINGRAFVPTIVKNSLNKLFWSVE